MKKIKFLIAFALLTLMLASCLPPREGHRGRHHNDRYENNGGYNGGGNHRGGYNY